MKFKISKVSENLTSNGNYIVTLKSTENKTVDLGGGITQSKSLTYFLAANGATKPILDAEIDLNLDLFEVIERPFPTTDKVTNEPITLVLKWLHLK